MVDADQQDQPQSQQKEWKKKRQLLRQLASEIMPTEKRDHGAKIFLRSKMQYHCANKGFQAQAITFK